MFIISTIKKTISSQKIYKVIVAGEGGVGKSTFLTSLVSGKFEEKMDITIGVDIYLYEFDSKLDSNKSVLQLWDLGGQDRFKFIHDSYVAGAKGVLLFYDLTRPETLANIDEWINICRNKNSDIPIILVGNKLDRYNGCMDNLDIDAILSHYQLLKHRKISSKEKIGFENLLNSLVNVLENYEDISEKISCIVQ